jgi:hypothetical protein
MTLLARRDRERFSRISDNELREVVRAVFDG